MKGYFVVLPALDRFVGDRVPSSHLLVKSATRIMSVPARDTTYQSTVRIVTMQVHIVAAVEAGIKYKSTEI